MNNVDARQVLQMFAALDSKRQKKAHRTALRKATGILVRETRKNFRKVVKNPNARNRWNGKNFSSGIKSKVNMSGRIETAEVQHKKSFVLLLVLIQRTGLTLINGLSRGGIV